MNRSVLRNRSGFTLIETLLALALSSVLLVVVFQLTDSTVTYHVTGNDQVLASQRMLGLLHDLRMDIRSVEPDPHWQAIPEVADVANADSPLAIEAAKWTSQLRLADLERLAEPIRLAGDHSWLLLTLGNANPRWSVTADQGQQIVWSAGNAITVSTHEMNGRLTNVVIPEQSSIGLFRARVNSANSIQAELVCPLRQLGFRYLGHGTWRSNWNSSRERGLPDAIEVSLWFEEESAPRSWVIQTTALNSIARSDR